MRSTARVVVALLALVAFSGSAWASCLGDAALEPQQMACCGAGHDQCPMHHRGASTCCATSVSQLQAQATVVKATTLGAPLLQAAVFITTPGMAISLSRLQFSIDASSRAVVQAPPYIAFAALLI